MPEQEKARRKRIEEWQANARAARASKAKAARRPWWDVLPGDYNELTRELDGAEADAIAEQHERDRLGY